MWPELTRRPRAAVQVTDGPGVEVVNEQLQVLLTLDPPNIPNVELEANGEWSQYVILDTMDEWLNLPDRNGKMLWIRGPSGTGKSTVYAAVLERAGMGRLSDPLSERYQLKKSRYNGAAVIFHAVRHNDLKTRSPLRIVHSLAWQLYKAFPDEVRAPSSGNRAAPLRN